jgi:hypothetical protein
VGAKNLIVIAFENLLKKDMPRTFKVLGMFVTNAEKRSNNYHF